MEKWWEFVWQLLIGVLIIFFGGWLLGFILNLVAMASPQMVSLVYCPAGSTATYISVFDMSSRNGSTITCRDQNGKSVPNLSDAESIVIQRQYFYRPSDYILIILVAGWLIWGRIKQKRPDSNSGR